jgi:peptidoglycan/LPS O-acetylase OafA/YrhL
MKHAAPQNLAALTALRFFAAMWVVFYHFWDNLGSPMPQIVAKGYLGVELFFVLSGFILCHVYLERFKDGQFSYRAFLWARLARIYPLHIAIIAGLLALILGLALLGIHAGDQLITWSSLPAQVTLTQAWGLGQAGGWNHPAWSISAEWFAYLSFPAFALLFARLWRRPGAAIAGTAVFMIVLQIVFERLAGFSLTHATILWGALRIVPCFALGSAIWLLWRKTHVTARRFGLPAAGGAMATLAAATGLQSPDWVFVLAFAALIYGLAVMSAAGDRILSHPALVYLGEVSFAIYMVCIPWQLVSTQGLQKVLHLDPGHLPVGLWLGIVAGVVPAAMLLHHLVERPARQLMRNLTFHRKPIVDVKARLRWQ